MDSDEGCVPRGRRSAANQKRNPLRIPSLPHSDSESHLLRFTNRSPRTPSGPSTTPVDYGMPSLSLDSFTKEILYSKPYCELTRAELATLQSDAILILNSIFKKWNLKLLPHDIASISETGQGNTNPTGSKKKWWSWKREEVKESESLTGVMKVNICKSIEYANVETDCINGCRRIPALVYECVKYLRENALTTVGLFRVSGSDKRINQLCAKFDMPPAYGANCDFSDYIPYDVADFLKKYLRTLPEPVCTSNLYSYFLQCLEIPASGGFRIQAARLLLMLLPPSHLLTLEHILTFLFDLSQHYVKNSMTASNLARILGPNILRPHSQIQQPLEDYEKCFNLFEMFVEQYDQFLITPADRKPFELLEKTYLPRFPIGIFSPVVYPIFRENNVQVVRAPGSVYTTGSTTTTITTTITTTTVPKSRSHSARKNSNKKSVSRSSSRKSENIFSDQVDSRPLSFASSLSGDHSNHTQIITVGADGVRREEVGREGLRRVRTAPVKKARSHAKTGSTTSSHAVSVGTITPSPTLLE